jgi:hypothetical protein
MKLQNRDFVNVETAKDVETLVEVIRDFIVMIACLALVLYGFLFWGAL